MADFKIGNVEFTIEGFSTTGMDYPGIAAHLSPYEQIERIQNDCAKPFDLDNLPNLTISANIIFVEDRFRLKGFRKSFRGAPLSKTRQARFTLSKRKQKRDFRQKAGVDRTQYTAAINRLFTPVKFQLEKDDVKHLLPNWCFAVRISVVNRVVLGRARGNGFDSYFEMSIPIKAGVFFEKFDDCNPENDRMDLYPFGGHVEEYPPITRPNEIELDTPKPTQKEVLETYRKFVDAEIEFCLNLFFICILHLIIAV